MILVRRTIELKGANDMTDYFNDPAYAEDINCLDENVTRGAQWLDGIDPTWYQKVQKDLLYMSSGYNCICGQVFRGKVQELREKQVSEAPEDGYGYFCANFDTENELYTGSSRGFTSDELPHIAPGNQWSVLADLWKMQVDKRLADAGLFISDE